MILLICKQEIKQDLFRSTSADNLRNKYVFDQNSDIILDHEDETGNRFKVNKIGKHFILALNNKNKSSIKKYQRHSPRFIEFNL